MRLIYRVDDRFIHGQVIEGWVNYYHIPNIIIVNDFIADDLFQRMVYESVIPSWAKLSFFSVSDFVKNMPCRLGFRKDTLILVGSILDLYRISSSICNGSYINIGCLAMGSRNYAVSDTVYLSAEELAIIAGLLGDYDIFAHKLPWESAVDLREFIYRIRDES